VATGFYWDGSSIGFNCFAQGCEGSSMSIGQVLKFLNKDHEPYRKLIWEEEELDDSWVSGDEMEDVPAPAVALTDVFTAAKEQCQAAAGTGRQCGGDHKYPQGNLSAETRATLKEIAEEAETVVAAPAVLAANELEPDETELAKGKLNERTMTLVTQRADTVKLERLEWLWTDRIPAGKITLLVGKPDCGKSLAMLNMIARITNGMDWPDGVKNVNGPKDVVLGATEDDFGTTLVPRLKAAGADLSHVHLVKRVIVEGKKTVRRMLQLKQDALLIKRMLRDHPGVALIALDPISGYFGEADPNKDKEIRPVLEAIQNACEKSHAALIGIVHHNKRGDADALGKVLGGSAVVGVSRAVWQFTRDSDNKEEFYMTLVKGNLAKKRTGMKYKISEAKITMSDGTDTGVPHTEWLGETNLDANEVLQQERDNAKSAGNQKVDVASLLIKSELESGAKMATDMYRKRDAEGIDERPFKNAFYKLGVVAVNRKGKWWWELPANSGKSRAIADAVARTEDVRIADTDVL
jgi:RecA-family ATPase